MTKQITLEELLELVTVEHDCDYNWYIVDVLGSVEGSVYGDVRGSVLGTVGGTIAGREWAYVETNREKLQRLCEETDDQELIDAFNRLEDTLSD